MILPTNNNFDPEMRRISNGFGRAQHGKYLTDGNMAYNSDFLGVYILYVKII